MCCIIALKQKKLKNFKASYVGMKTIVQRETNPTCPKAKKQTNKVKMKKQRIKQG